MYALAGVLLVYSLWAGLNTSSFLGICVLISSVAAAVQGYLVGFRAWQIQHRRLISLREAVLIPDTYLVL